MNFPNCTTCIHVHSMPDAENQLQQWHVCFNEKISVGTIKKPDQHFCSEHETKTGDRFVNWGNNELSKT